MYEVEYFVNRRRLYCDPQNARRNIIKIDASSSSPISNKKGLKKKRKNIKKKSEEYMSYNKKGSVVVGPCENFCTFLTKLEMKLILLILTLYFN